MTTRNTAAEIIDLCNHAGEPTMAASLVREGVTLEAARERINYAGNVRDAVAVTRRMAPSLKVGEDFVEKAIAARMPVAEVRRNLLDSLAAADEAIVIDHHKRTGDGSLHAQQRSAANMIQQIEASGQKPVKRKR